MHLATKATGFAAVLTNAVGLAGCTLAILRRDVFEFANTFAPKERGRRGDRMRAAGAIAMPVPCASVGLTMPPHRRHQGELF
jgi:hypothetical protein